MQEYTGDEQKFVVPYNLNYQIETWGAQGGNSTYNNASYEGGYGAYSTGTIDLIKDERIYINVGGQGGGFRAITELTGQDMTYAGFGGSSWGDTTNGTGYNSVSGGATEGGNGKVIISWVNSPLQGLNDYNQENKDW